MVKDAVVARITFTVFIHLVSIVGRVGDENATEVLFSTVATVNSERVNAIAALCSSRGTTIAITARNLPVNDYRQARPV